MKEVKKPYVILISLPITGHENLTLERSPDFRNAVSPGELVKVSRWSLIFLTKNRWKCEYNVEVDCFRSLFGLGLYVSSSL